MSTAEDKNILLATLGTSWMVVVEALYFPKLPRPLEVYVLTGSGRNTDQPIQNLVSYFERRLPEFRLLITRIGGFDALLSAQEQELFEEALYRWYLEKSFGRKPYVCVAGGYKTMSSTLQKAASLFGAQEVFHVLVDPLPSTEEELEKAITNQSILYVSLGEEPGWPSFLSLPKEKFSLKKIRDNKQVEEVAIEESPLADFSLTREIQRVTQRAAHLFSHWEKLSQLPFPVLATWSPQELAWLSERLDPESDRAWVQSLPKLDLHSHLGGFATHGFLLQRVRSQAQGLQNFPPEPPLPKGWPEPIKPIDLDKYMELGNATGSQLLKDPGCLRAQCELLYEHLQADRVVYAEIRCSPNNYATFDRSAWQVLSEIQSHFQRCMDRAGASDCPCQVQLIIVATRKSKGDLSDISRHLSLAVAAQQHYRPAWGRCGVVGVDLAGFESPKTRATYFAENFVNVHRCGLAVTAHAGENDDAEGIWQAIFRLHARRIGHGLRLLDSEDLLGTVVERRIGIEMCPYANYQVRGFLPMEKKASYPLKKYLDRGIAVSVNTDNIGISQASLSENLLFLGKLFPDVTRLDLLRLLSNSVETAFLPFAQKTQLREVVQRLIPRPWFL